MRTRSLMCILLVLVLFSGCKKDTDHPSNSGDWLRNMAEKFLFLKSGSRVYFDDNGNTYLTTVFSPDQLHHVYSVFFEKGKKYNLSISGNYCGPVDFILFSSDGDSLFYGEQGDVGLTRRYIVWTSDQTDTLYLSARYTEDINFHTYEYHITFEELTIHRLELNGISFDCSGDWFISKDNYLALACHQSSYSKWAKVVDETLFNYELSFQVGLKSGIPDIYTGAAFYAGDEIFEMVNIPARCYEFKIIGPSTWEQWTWDQGVGRDWGETSVSLNRGQGAFNKMELVTANDSIWLRVNDEQVKSYKNLHFLDNGLYLVVDDQKNDTVYFRDIELIKLD